MTLYPKIQLSQLRQIGWDEWDPIGIRQFGDDWQSNAADEYDRYLLQVVSMLNRGGQIQDAVKYLDDIASEYMGLGPRTTEGREASAKTVNAIAAYLRSLPEGPLSEAGRTS